VALEFRWAEGQYGRFPELAADLVRRGVSVIVAPGSGAAALAAKSATTTIPIVVGAGGDPVGAGWPRAPLVMSLGLAHTKKKGRWPARNRRLSADGSLLQIGHGRQVELAGHDEGRTAPV